jgi:hypothetical protein
MFLTGDNKRPNRWQMITNCNDVCTKQFFNLKATTHQDGTTKNRLLQEKALDNMLYIVFSKVHNICKFMF